jgi:hypothetical protein
VSTLDERRVDPQADVETRRYALRSLGNIAIQPIHLPAERLNEVLEAAINALSDYSTDQRGDIGSWIRITGLSVLGQVLSVSTTYSEVSQTIKDSAIGGIIKQSVEKLEPCRAQAHRTMVQLRQSGVVWSGCGAMKFENGSM